MLLFCIGFACQELCVLGLSSHRCTVMKMFFSITVRCAVTCLRLLCINVIVKIWVQLPNFLQCQQSTCEEQGCKWRGSAAPSISGYLSRSPASWLWEPCIYNFPQPHCGQELHHFSKACIASSGRWQIWGVSQCLLNNQHLLAASTGLQVRAFPQSPQRHRKRFSLCPTTRAVTSYHTSCQGSSVAGTGYCHWLRWIKFRLTSLTIHSSVPLRLLQLRTT